MIKEIRFSEEFQKAFKRLKKRYHSLPDDFKGLLLSLQVNPFQGVELHDGMRKVRLSIVSKGKGKRGGGRVIIRLTIEDTCLSFLYIYDKSEMENVSDQFLDQIIMEIDQRM
ncbi:MAG: addiction module toxin RelE [Bacteroidales bacterium]|nr:addiction module toxin RelE [Bacteroidales bacterium]